MTFLLPLLAVIAFAILVVIGGSLFALIRDDGYRRTARRTPPRSHHADAFDPRSRIA